MWPQLVKTVDTGASVQTRHESAIAEKGCCKMTTRCAYENRVGHSFNITRKNMESFVELSSGIKGTRSALATTAVIGVAALGTTLAWYGQRAICQLLPFLGTCREFPQYFVLLLVLFVAQVLMLAMAVAASLGTNLPFVKATLGAAVAAVIFDVAALMIAIFVVGTDNYLAFTIALSVALAVAVVIMVEAAVLLFQMTEWYHKASRQLDKALKSTFKVTEMGKLPKSMLRAQRRLITLSEVDFMLVALLLLGLIGFTIIPNSWRVVQTEVFFVVLLFSGLHSVLWVFYRAVAGLPSVYDQLQDTVLLPMSDSLIVVTIVAAATDVLLVTGAAILIVLELVLYDGPSAPVAVYWAMSIGIILVLFVVIDAMALQSLTIFRAGTVQWRTKIWTMFGTELSAVVSPETQKIPLRPRDGQKRKLN